jgi:hypothetical protein
MKVLKEQPLIQEYQIQNLPLVKKWQLKKLK